MTRLFWYFMLAISGGLIGISLVGFFTQTAGAITIYLLILGLILSVISFWGAKKYAGIGFFSNKSHK